MRGVVDAPVERVDIGARGRRPAAGPARPVADLGDAREQGRERRQALGARWRPGRARRRGSRPPARSRNPAGAGVRRLEDVRDLPPGPLIDLGPGGHAVSCPAGIAGGRRASRRWRRRRSRRRGGGSRRRRLRRPTRRDRRAEAGERHGDQSRCSKDGDPGSPRGARWRSFGLRRMLNMAVMLGTRRVARRGFIATGLNRFRTFARRRLLASLAAGDNGACPGRPVRLAK